MEGTVVWLTGIPGSGKTTIANKVKELLEGTHSVELLDGDAFRQTVSKDLGYTAKDREENVRRVIFRAKSLSSEGATVLVSFTSPSAALREFARTEIPNFIEVFVKASVEECIKRDPKGLYKKALAGEIKNFVPLDIPYEEPKNPDLTLDTEKFDTKECAQMVLDAIKNQARKTTAPKIASSPQSRAGSASKKFLVASAILCILGGIFLYYDLDIVPPAGQWNFSEAFYVGIGFLVGSISTVILFGLQRSSMVVSKTRS